MDGVIAALLPQAPTVAILLIVGMAIRSDVNKHFEYLETLVDTLIALLMKDRD